jgi:hypothetical protein
VEADNRCRESAHRRKEVRLYTAESGGEWEGDEVEEGREQVSGLPLREKWAEKEKRALLGYRGK